METKQLILFFQLATFVLGCDTDLDCSLGGRCMKETKTCECSKEWTGDDCGVLALLPAEVDNGFHPLNSSSWGGKIVLGSSGEYHLYSAKMAGNCGLTTWGSNSEVVHSISHDTPIGPYTEVVSETPIVNYFSHNPTVERVATESGDPLYVMAHIGCGGGTTKPRQCENGTTPKYFSEKNDDLTGCDSSHWAGMHTAPTPEGPWVSVTPNNQPMVITNPNPDEDTWHLNGGKFTNPSIWAFDNGAILLAYSYNCWNCNISQSYKHVGVAYAETWSGPYIDLTPKEPIFPFASEDPCIFVSPETGTYHVLAHATGNWHGVSAHAFAYEPRGPWIVSETIPYDKTIEWVTGEKRTVQKRERPQVVFMNGVPSYLVNGVEPNRTPTPLTPGGYTGDWTYTHVQAIRT